MSKGHTRAGTDCGGTDASPSGLGLPGDRSPDAQGIASYLDAWAGDDRDRTAAARVVVAVAAAAVPVARRLAQGELPGDPKRSVGVNTAGDTQKALDVAAHEHFVHALTAAGARAILSEETEEVIAGARDGTVSVAIDPIDGSGSIGIGAPLGTLFAIYPAAEGGDDFLVSGRAMLGAGYVSFGHSVDLGFSLGDGVVIATLDPADGTFRVVDTKVRLPHDASEIAFNASVARHWQPGVRAYVDDCIAGRDGPRGRDVNMRWLAAAVGELHRILRRGGMFFYVADRRPGYEAGRLRLVYEANPIAFLCEQAGGAATDGVRPILDLLPETLHSNVPLVFGCAGEVATFGRYAARDA